MVIQQAYAEVYLTETQAAEALLPGQKLEKLQVTLTREEAAKIAQDSGETVRSQLLTVFKSPSRDFIFIDQVLGKHEFIPIAVAISKDGKVKGVEILEYRESYGQGVREHAWNNQFIGKNSSDELRLNKDIKNISGATLSSAHVTAGVRRLLRTYEQLHARL